jgi:hypothetical protein
MLLPTDDPKAVVELKKYIRALNVPDRNVIWVWLDGNPDALRELIEAAAENTPDLSNPDLSEDMPR